MCIINTCARVYAKREPRTLAGARAPGNSPINPSWGVRRFEGHTFELNHAINADNCGYVCGLSMYNLEHSARSELVERGLAQDILLSDVDHDWTLDKFRY